MDGVRCDRNSRAGAADKRCAGAQGEYPPVVHLTAEQDHQRTMELLGIKELRPGRDGSHPEFAELCELRRGEGESVSGVAGPAGAERRKRVKSAKVWWKERRPQIVEMFDREIYGRVPAHTPAVHWEVTATKRGEDGGVPTITKTLVGHVDNSAYP